MAYRALRFVNPTEVGWAMKFDWATHYFGWKFFRIEPWQWPPGTVSGYNAPIGTAIGLTDSLPLLAYLFKPLSPLAASGFPVPGRLGAAVLRPAGGASARA